VKLPLPTERLEFRAWTELDLHLANALFGDPEVTALVGGPFDAAAVRARLAAELANQRDCGYAYWPIFLHTGAFAGCCGLKPREPARRIHELGFYLRPAYWGQGLAVEAGRSVIAHTWDVLDAAGLFAGHHPSNTGSKKTLERLGFRFTHEELYPPTGLLHPGYELLRPAI
jgi:RimJ/RimL family protein N-acetyltransferase